MERLIPEEMHVEKLKPEHIEQFDDLLRYAFQVTEEELLRVGWEDEDIRQSKFPILKSANVLGWFDGDRLASQIAVYPMRMNVHGCICKMGFVTGVATYPEYSGMGLMSELMKRALADMRAAGQSISLLYPYSIPLYRRKGWEIISDKMTFTVKDFQLPRNLDAPGMVRRVADDCPDLLEVHERFTLMTHGCIFRNELAWEEYWRWDVEDTTVAVYYGESGTPLGYMVYLLKREILHVKEMVCLDQEAWNGLWAYISAHESMVVEVNGDNYSNTPIAFWLEDSDIKETIRPYMMARIVDIEQFLACYSFDDNCRAEDITFVVSDPMLEWNNRPFTLRLDPSGRFELAGSMAEKRVELSIGTLTTLLMSYKSAGYLRAIGRLAADDATIDFLDDVIRTEKAYISEYM